MNDRLEVLRAANPVPSPRPLDADAARRVRTAVRAAAAAHAPADRVVGTPSRRSARLRLVVGAAVALTLAGSAAAAIALLGGQPSAAPSGRFAGAAKTNGDSAYALRLAPNLQGGSVGWCLTAVVLGVRGEFSAGSGCEHAPTSSRPVVSLGGNVSGSSTPTHSVIVATSVFLTTDQVAAVRLSPTLTVLTRRDAQLPANYRVAITIETRPGARPPRWGRLITEVGRADARAAAHAVALDSGGHPIGLPVSSVAEHDSAVYWLRNGSLPDARTAPKQTPPPGACEIAINTRRGVSPEWGWVVQYVHGFADVAGDSYLSCASTDLFYRNAEFVAAILLDARDPGAAPALLPDSSPVPGRSQTFNVPGPGPARVVAVHDGPITARRIGNALLVVQAVWDRPATTLATRLALLDQLQACTHLAGALCSAPRF